MTNSLSIRQRYNLDGRIAVVTGASKGIGAAIAKGLAEFGAHVVVTSRKLESVESIAQDIQENGGHAWAKACHVGDPEQRTELIQAVIDRFGRVDILVNNAAINPYYGPLEGIDDLAFQKTFEVNLNGPRTLSNQVAHQMKEQKSGSIIHISSIESFHPGQGMGVYSMTKAALNMLTMSQAREWGRYGIRVNAIAPGLIETKFSRVLIENAEIQKFVRQQLPAGRIGQPEDIAGLAVFLASDAAAYCTGAIYTADGGFLISGGL